MASNLTSKELVANPNCIFLYIPNIIGFARVILVIVSFYFMPTNFVVASTCYVASVLLDAFDGYAARHFQQNTKFGAILDQLTDRCSTMGLLVILTHFYPKYSFWFQISMTIDIACHWIHLHATLLRGGESHKSIGQDENPIMQLYYTNRNVLFILCAANEGFFCSLYLLHFTTGPANILIVLAALFTPFMIVKTAINLLQGYIACKKIALIDVKERFDSSE